MKFLTCQKFTLSKSKKNILPGVTHIDGTARLQTVSKENNESIIF